MSKIRILLNNNQEFFLDKPCKAIQFLKTNNINLTEVLAIRFNNQICSLEYMLDVNGTVELVQFGTHAGSAVYRRSLCFLLTAVAHELFAQKQLIIGHSLGYGFYYTIEGENEVSQQTLDSLTNKMNEYIQNDYPITQTILSYEQTLELTQKFKMTEVQKQLQFICPPKFIIDNLKNFADICYAPLVPSCKLLKHFNLLKYGEGFLLQYPSTSNPHCVAPFEDIPQLFTIYQQYKNWGKLLNIQSVASLNEHIAYNKSRDFINSTEILQNKQIGDIAEKIKNHPKTRVILIAGPSSSGKTTTSKKLAMNLQVLGYTPKVIELDSYYVGRDLTPKNEKGEYDYECLEALDVKQLNIDLENLFAGKEINLPSYDFVEGKRYYTDKKLKLKNSDILIMEGIHGLNDKLTPSLPHDVKFKLYLSALTQLNLDNHNRISTSDNRLVRRIVRDARFRGKSAADTIKMWPNVQKGERKYIFPFQNMADVMLNTALDYELAVLKMYAEPLLRCVSPLEHEYAEATRLLRFLNNFSPIPVNLVPTQSLLREFIGGSDFKY